MTLVVTPPLRRFAGSKTVFLAGSIEMGEAHDWQADAIRALSGHMNIIYNPRRPNWDSSWVQEIDNPEFNAQVNWELDMIAEADNVVFYFDPITKSPVTLMELGTCIGRGASISVCCPKGYWRKGNVDIICDREGFKTYDTFKAMMAAFGHRSF